MGRAWGAAPTSVNLGPPPISETTKVRKLKFYTPLDGAKCFFMYEHFSASTKWN